MASGICKLTGEFGKYVDSHLLPKALTKAGGLGVPFTKSGMGRRPSTRHSSWYDNRLVTQAGEDILAKLDDWAIKELRKARLVWSDWGPMTKLTDARAIPWTEWGIRFNTSPESAAVSAMLLGVTCVVVIAGMAVVFGRRKNALLSLQSAPAPVS
ncbi:hypothetical protein [Mesorhizobium sp. M0276]|uniref:hypothetical protein n=1 Tax=Mesorhizobium sp. M0276 TaxID=2956928 RepID=UPI003336ACDD